jgi:hypothetical protein
MSYKESIYDKMTNAENMVSDFLKYLTIRWVFESPVFVTDDADRPRVWSPDFYLPELGMYIEVACDVSNRNYDYRAKVYKKNRIPIIFVQPYDDKYWKRNLVESLKVIHQQRWELLKVLK